MSNRLAKYQRRGRISWYCEHNHHEGAKNGCLGKLRIPHVGMGKCGCLCHRKLEEVDDAKPAV